MIIHLLLEITDLRPGKSNQFKGKVGAVNDSLFKHEIMKITMAKKKDLNVATQFMYVIQTVYCPHHMRILTVMHVVQSNPALRTLAEHGQFALSLGKNTDTFPGPLS